MPPKARLHPHLTADQLESHYRQAQDRVESRRWHLLYLVSQQWTIKKSAHRAGLSYDYAKTIVRRYNQEGPGSVYNQSKRRSLSHGRSLLSPQQQQQLRHLLQRPPSDGGTWTGPKVARWIALTTGRKHVWPQRGWEYLKRLGSKLPPD